MAKELLEDKIKLFWKWFNQNKTILQEVVANPYHLKKEWVIEQLDQHVLAFGKLKWEIENPTNNAFIFTFSPNGDFDLLQKTKTIIAASNPIPNWTFNAARKATGNYSIEVYDHLMDVQEINAENWRIVLIDSSKNSCDMILEANNLHEIDVDTRLIAANLILNNIIGEEAKINHVNKLEIVLKLATHDSDFCFPIKELAYQLFE